MLSIGMSETRIAIKKYYLKSNENIERERIVWYIIVTIMVIKKDEWSIRLGNTGYRVTMIPCDDFENEIIEGDIMAQCKMIKIVRVTEVSNHYE